MLAAQIPNTAWVAKDQLKYSTILAKTPVVPRSALVEGSNENLDSVKTTVWFKITFITCVFPSLKSEGDHGAVKKWNNKYLESTILWYWLFLWFMQSTEG